MDGWMVRREDDLGAKRCGTNHDWHFRGLFSDQHWLLISMDVIEIGGMFSRLESRRIAF